MRPTRKRRGSSSTNSSSNVCGIYLRPTRKTVTHFVSSFRHHLARLTHLHLQFDPSYFHSFFFLNFGASRMAYGPTRASRSATNGYVRPCMTPIHQNAEMMESRNRMNACGGAHRLGGVTRTVFKVACAQTETQGEGGARGRPLGNATGRPSIHGSNTSCQRWREVRGKTRRPRGRCHHHDHSHRHLVRKTRGQVQTTHRRGCGRARPGGHAAATNATG